MLTVDIKYKEQWTGTLPTRFLIISNELPRFGDASGAIATRFVTLVLTQSWLGRENTKLTNELREELPGILSWALDGLDRLNTEGRFTDPSRPSTRWSPCRDLVSPVSAFVRERCTVGPHEVLVKELYDAWKTGPRTTATGPAPRRSAVICGLPNPTSKSAAPGGDDHRDKRQYLGITLKHRVPKGDS